MKLKQLRCVVGVADNDLHVTAAAERLCTSQSAVSKQIILLERELSLQLFERRAKSLCGVTAAGEQVIARARVILREVDRIHAACRALVRREGDAGTMRQFARGSHVGYRGNRRP